MTHVPKRTILPVRYNSLNLTGLLSRIVNESDRDALAEFHNNRDVFVLDSGESVIFLNLIDRICNCRWALEMVHRNYSMLESSYDLIVARYSYMPDRTQENGSQKSIDCRKYFKACLNKVEHECKNIEDPIRKDIHAALILQKMIINNYAYCCKEALRSNDPSWSRYIWQVDGQSITVWMPAFLRGRQRYKWLTSNIPDAKPHREGERQRIQEIVDGHFERYSRCHIDSSFGIADSSSPSPYELLIKKEIQTEGLAETVAKEKCRDIALLRPSIRKIGKSSLYKLVKTIFERIENDRYEETQVARLFGLSPATLCRFAGIKWELSTGRRPPDLWSNLAQVLAEHSLFTDVARQCGIWQGIQNIVSRLDKEI